MALRIELDTEKKTIKLLENYPLDKLIELLDENIKDWKTYTLIAHTVETTVIPFTNPWVVGPRENPYAPPYQPQVWYTTEWEQKSGIPLYRANITIE